MNPLFFHLPVFCAQNRPRGHAASLRGEPPNSWGCAPQLCPRRWLNLASPQLQIRFFLFFPSFPPASWHSGSCCHFSSRRAGVCHPEPRGCRGGRGGRGRRGGWCLVSWGPLCAEVAVLLVVTGLYWMCTFVFFPPLSISRRRRGHLLCC